MMPSLMIDHLSINLRSGTDNLVSEISFAIKEGESLILLGQSGSGKTMTCSAVLNLLDPKKFKVSGSVFFGETDLLNSSEKQRRGIYGNQIVYIPQNPMTALDPSMRIGRQMDETLRLHSDKSRQQRYNYILRLLHDVGLDDPDRVYRAYPHMLSGGMLQRVIIAMAMMLDAKFVLADEPTTALDVIHRNTWYGALMAGEYDLTFYNTAGGSFDPATDMSNMAPGAMGDPILCQFSAFFENPEIFAELDSTSDSRRVQEIYGMILNGIADQNLLVPVTGTHDLALWNTDKITGYDFYTDASYVDIASVHVK